MMALRYSSSTQINNSVMYFTLQALFSHELVQNNGRFLSLETRSYKFQACKRNQPKNQSLETYFIPFLTCYKKDLIMVYYLSSLSMFICD